MIGKQLGNYEIREPLGKGGIATVYKAYHAATDRLVAVKVLLPNLAHDPTFNERFDREAKVVANLQHLHILPVYDYGHEGDTAYLVMPLLTGGTLSEQRRRKNLSLGEVARIFRLLASALDYAHQQGLLHRDIKPSNVLLDGTGNPFLADFGLTRMMDSDESAGLTGSGVIGTPAYMSPEQGQGLPLDSRSDLYAMGVMLYEMLVGEVPFRAETPIAVIFKHVRDPLPSLLAQRPDLPPALEGVLAKAMAKDPNNRYRTASELADALEFAISGYDQSASMTLPLATARSASQPSAYPTDSLTDVPTQYGSTVKPTASKVRLPAFARYAIPLVLVAVVAVIFFRPAPDPSAIDSNPLQNLLIEAHTNGVRSVDFSASGEQIASGGGDNFTKIWSTATGALELTLEGHGSSVIFVAFDPDSPEIFTTANDNTGRTWLLPAGTQDKTNFEGAPVQAADYSWQGTYFAYSVKERVTVAAGAIGDFLFEQFQPENKNFTALAFHPNEKTLAVGDETGQVHFFDLTSEGTNLKTLSGLGTISSLAFSPNGQLLAVATVDGDLLWVVLDGEKQQKLSSEAAEIDDIAFSPDGELLATAGADGVISLWNVADQSLAARLEGHVGKVYSLDFHPNGQLLASGGADGTLRLWNVPN